MTQTGSNRKCSQIFKPNLRNNQTVVLKLPPSCILSFKNIQILDDQRIHKLQLSHNSSGLDLTSSSASKVLMPQLNPGLWQHQSNQLGQTTGQTTSFSDTYNLPPFQSPGGRRVLRRTRPLSNVLAARSQHASSSSKGWDSPVASVG